MQRGFTLIQISILLVLASLVLVACLPAMQSVPVSNNSTTVKMNKVLQALRQFEVANSRLPCPADATQPAGGALYGVESANGGASGGCTGGAPEANAVDGTNNVAIGMVPVRALGLSNDYATDSWGRNLTYAVDTNATSCFSGTLPGAITVTDNGAPVNTVAALVSHGNDGHGAWLPLTGTSGSAVRLNAGSTDADQLTNAHLNTSFAATSPLTRFVRKPPTPGFDDVVLYRSALWNLNTSPASTATGVLPTLTPPASGTYMTGEMLGFTLRFSTSVNVTGVPEIALNVGGVTRYATYTGGSGSVSLSFSYTVQSTDYAPTGISSGSSVILNGGTVSTPCTSFSPRGLSGVQIKKLYIYVADYNNNRVQVFDANGNYLSQFGGHGLLAGLFNHPDQIVIDGSGNAWVSDWGNSRVQEFNSGSAIGGFGSLGILNGQFVNPSAIAIDGSGNFWVVDNGNDRVQEFSSTGSYESKFGSLGALNGQLLLPNGIAIDGSGNIWVADSGNNRIEKFNSGGTYLLQFGTNGTGNGLFSAPCAEAIDSSGNLWVTDSGNARVQKFDTNGNYLGQFGTFGTGNGQFSSPCGLSIDLAGNLWVADSLNNRVEKFNSSGGYLGQFGSFGAGNGQFFTTAGIALQYQ